MGWFLHDTKLALVQMPHYFFSPDPFERNLDTHGKAAAILESRAASHFFRAFPDSV